MVPANHAAAGPHQMHLPTVAAPHLPYLQHRWASEAFSNGLGEVLLV
eukprot:CAMPEP_0178416394 /NCGR_PEP_ID=MMETSP0689_2-20121128/24041_1 /TAXON_ID=160604 /ORGANISM="Amphidinium massartii, Strain CS-259" /LENGTH=46 /DNA_ID= /DNA_START= /DNA_END= /DNA_ORIENTATION=